MKGIFVAAASAALLIATPASALVTFTWTGEINQGHDTYGLFGAAGSLAGKSYTLTTTYDLSKPLFTNPGVSQVVQGPGANSPLLDATIEINGVTYDFLFAAFSEASVSAGSGRVDNSFHYQEQDGLGFDFLDALSFSFIAAEIPATLATAFSTTAGANLFPLSSFNIWAKDNDTNTFYRQVSAEAIVDRVTSTGDITAVPEPATWAMMILGFGSAGAMLRRRRALAYA